MFKKTMKKILCGALAVTSVVACMGTMTACETNHPEVEMKIEFAGETYKLEYKLYRKVAPNTVNHFIWLAENGYYNELCVHNYVEDSKLYTGAYSAATDEDDDDGLVYKDYFAFAEKTKKYPHSVWMDREKTMPTYTLYGEFQNNDFQVKNNPVKESFGSLSMYYHAFDTSARVYALRADSDDGAVSGREYRYNCATSMFYINLSNSNTVNKAYATFAMLDKDSKDDLKDLQEAIKEYAEKNYGDEDESFVKSVSVNVSEHDNVIDETVSVSYKVPQTAIVIKSVKVTKY